MSHIIKVFLNFTKKKGTFDGSSDQSSYTVVAKLEWATL